MSQIQALPASEATPEAAIPPTPPSLPSIPTPPTNIPSAKSFLHWIPLYLSKTDLTVVRLNKALSTPSGTDTLLSTICYTSLLTSSILSSISEAQLRKRAKDIIDKVTTLQPGSTVVIAGNVSRVKDVAVRLKLLSSLISEFRTFTRLWGLLSLWKWGRNTLLKTRGEGEHDRVGEGIQCLQVLVNVAYQYLENVAYLSSKGIGKWDRETQGRAWLWSSRFWMGHVLLEFCRLGREWRSRLSKGEKEGDKEWWTNWRRELLVNFAWAPLTIHWGLEGGLVTEFWVGVLGSTASVAGLKKLGWGV